VKKDAHEEGGSSLQFINKNFLQKLQQNKYNVVKAMARPCAYIVLDQAILQVIIYCVARDNIFKRKSFSSMNSDNAKCLRTLILAVAFFAVFLADQLPSMSIVYKRTEHDEQNSQLVVLTEKHEIDVRVLRIDEG
jgi:hypothetical protein